MLKILFIIIISIVIENIINHLFAISKFQMKKGYYNQLIDDKNVKNRIIDILGWYEKYAFIYRSKHICYSMLSIIFSTLIPVITIGEYSIISLDITDNKLLIGWISAILSMISGYLFLRSPKERWYEYRKGAEDIKKILSIGYIKNSPEKEILLEIENRISVEQDNWYSKKNKSSIEKYKAEEE